MSITIGSRLHHRMHRRVRVVCKTLVNNYKGLGFVASTVDSGQLRFEVPTLAAYNAERMGRLAGRTNGVRGEPRLPPE
jgi:hypothetical protein